MFLILTILKVFFLAIPDENGWVPVESPAKVEEEEETKGWVLFSLALGEEKFWVRFPVEPVYTYTPDGVELKAECEEGVFQLNVIQKENIDLTAFFADRKAYLKDVSILEEEIHEDVGQAHLAYLQDGTKVSEDFQITPHALYHFQTHHQDPHQKFAASLQVFPQ